MNWADYTLIGIIGVSVIISLFRGLIREVMALAVWVLAFWAAFTFADDAEMHLAATVDLPSARLAIAFALIFIVALLLGALINFLIGQLIDKTGLSGTDRFFGMFFGAARAVVLITAGVLLAGLTPLPRDGWWQDSLLLPRFQALATWSTRFLPPQVQDYFQYGVPEQLIEPQPSGDNTAPEVSET